MSVSAQVTATEEHPPNVKLATERLAPLGVRVEPVRLTELDPLPFDEAEFDVVLNRHSAFNCGEVARIVAPGGTFVTQQVIRTLAGRGRVRDCQHRELGRPGDIHGCRCIGVLPEGHSLASTGVLGHHPSGASSATPGAAGGG